MALLDKLTRYKQTPTEQDILNMSFDGEIQVIAHEIVGSPEAIGAGTRNMYGVKVFSSGGLAVVNPDGTNVFSGGSITVNSAPTYKDDPTNALELPKYGKTNSISHRQMVEAGTILGGVNADSVTSNTTRVQLHAASIPAINGILVGAWSTNAAPVVVGGVTVTASANGVEILPGASQPFTVTDLNLLYVIGANASDKVWFNVL